MKPKVYIETTIPSYLTAWPSRDLVRAAHQQLTREWWAGRDKFDLYTSRVVVNECQAGDAQAAADRLAALSGISVLEVTTSALKLADDLIRTVPLPDVAATDALHIAIAAVEGMNHLLTWNCAHNADAILRPRIDAACRAAEHAPPLICTPQHFISGRQADDRG